MIGGTCRLAMACFIKINPNHRKVDHDPDVLRISVESLPCQGHVLRRRVEGSNPTAIFIFGDSYADIGNHNSTMSSWKPSYGTTFTGKPVGRYLDGRLLTNFVGAFKEPVLKPCCIGKTKFDYCGSVDEEGKALYSVYANPESTFFWDEVHPSQAAWKALIGLLSPSLH
eukprot:Gb_06040 [translate_table: standard]